jgi:3-oxoacyl-[acyl-carrier-protein] synthase II
LSNSAGIAGCNAAAILGAPGTGEEASMGDRRVVITGLGPLSALGIGRDAFRAAIEADQSAIAPAARIDTSECDASLAAEVPDFDVQELLESRKAYLDPSSKYALGAVALALRDAGLDERQRESAGICLGTTFGSMETLGMFFEGFLEKGPRFVKPFLFQHTYANTAIGLAAIEFGLRGDHLNFAGAFTAGAQAIAAAYDLISSGKADRVVAGGYDALSDYLYAGLDAMGQDDLVPGEGAGAIVLEEEESARARGATIHARIRDIEMAGDPNASILEPLAGECTIALKELTGETFAASAPLQVIAAAEAMGATPGPETALVTAVDPGGETVCIALETTEGDS